MNENAAYIFDVEEPTTWVFEGEPVWIKGWFVSKTGAAFHDIRAVIEGIPHLGVFGIPRPEIEEKYAHFTAGVHVGFLLRVQPPRSARLLRIELLDHGGNWVEIWRTKIRTVRGQNTVARFHLPLLPLQMRRLLQARRADPRASVEKEAERLALEAAAVPLNIEPAELFHGSLDVPALVGDVQFGKIRVEGWMFHEKRPIKTLLGSTRPGQLNVLDYGTRASPQAAARAASHPQAANAGFFGLVDIDERAPSPAAVMIFAEFEDGSRELALIKRVHLRISENFERPLPAFSRSEFLDAAQQLIAASRKHRIRLGRWGARWRAFLSAYRSFRDTAPAQIAPAPDGDAYAAWWHANRITPRLQDILAARSRQLAEAPTLSVLVDLSSGSERAGRLLESLRRQIHPRWEACFVGESNPGINEARCRFVQSKDPKDKVRALNEALAGLSGTIVTLIPAHTQLSPDAVLEIVERFAQNPELVLAYTDEDRISDDEQHTQPWFKPDWSPALALSGLFPGDLSAVTRARLLECGSFREGSDRVVWYDALLRTCDGVTADRVAHVPLVCLHVWDGAPQQIELADPSYEQARAALESTLSRRGMAAQPLLPEIGHHLERRFHQLRWDPAIAAELNVTVVIPTRDRLHLLQECVELLEETVDLQRIRLVIVDDHSRDADAVRYLARIQERTDLRCTVVRLPDGSAPFNYSRLVNAALPHVQTPLILHLNNDVNALERGWLEEMVGWFTQPDIGVVGAKLVFPDKTLNHTGIVIGPHGGLADTPFAKVEEKSVDVAWHAAAREVSAVTGACLLTRTDLYRELGGFDENDFGVAYNDVDYCLRVRAAGRRVIYTPQARLMHWGSATRGVTFDEAEHVAWLRRYPGYRDPYFSPHLTLDGANVRCRGPVHARPDRAPALRLLLLTHNLNLEGAPLFLLEYAEAMVRDAGFKIEVMSAQDGPLRSRFEALGGKVFVASTEALYASPEADTFHSRLIDLSDQVDWEHVDVVVCNTLASFWGVLAARRSDKPSLFYIHESSSVFRFFERKLQPSLHRFASEALETATRTLFLCDASRRYHDDLNRRGNFRVVPSWIRLEEIAAFKNAHSRGQLRQKHGLGEREIVIANIGTVCERKGQHTFIRAIEIFNRLHRGPDPVRFVMVGARPGIYLDLLQRDLERLRLPNVMFVPETRDVFEFFVAADMFVCTSFEESFPRVVMEAMAFQTPIVSTDVHGIAELIGQRQDGYLVRPGDAAGLARMMLTCLSKERSGKSLAPTAYSKILRRCDSRRVLPFHADLAREAYLVHE